MKLAIISDIHFGKHAISREFTINGEELSAEAVSGAKPLLDGAVEILNNEAPDFLLIPGDLTSTGSPLEFYHCYNCIIDIADRIGVPKEHVVFCMGNHDVDWSISDISDQYLENKKMSEKDKEYVDNYYQKRAIEVGRDIFIALENPVGTSFVTQFEHPFCGIKEYDECVFFILNSSVKSSRKQEFKHGVLSETQYKLFLQQVGKYHNTKKKKILLLHHHPHLYEDLFPGMDTNYLEEGPKLLNICGDQNIRLIIHGHKHQPQAMTVFHSGWKNPVSLVCAGSFSVNSNERMHSIPNTFHIIEYNSEESILLNSFSYTQISGWYPSVYSSETPVDDKMRLGKTFDLEEVEECINRMPILKSIGFNDLEKPLQYLPRKKLVKLIEEFRPKCKVSFSEDNSEIIIICSKE